jgi:hypothetical protein
LIEMQNRNVVSRARPRAQAPQRDAARTIEFDCTAVANLLDAQSTKPPAPDLDAEIEVVSASPEQAARASKDRFAHTMKRAGAALAAEGSRPMLPLAAPPITEEEIEEADTNEELGPNAVTRAMAVVNEPAFELPAPAPAARARGSWLLPLGVALVTGSAVMLLSVLV